MTKIFVIAGNHEEAQGWIRFDISRRWGAGETSANLSEYIIVDSPTRVKGYQNPHGIFTGSWRSRKDILDIALTLSLSSNPRNDAITNIIRELQ